MKGKLFALLIVVLLLNVTLVAALPWWLEWFVKPFTQAQSITGQQVVVGPGGTTCPGTPCQGKQNNDACGFQSICWNCQCVFVGGGGGTTVTPGCDPSFSEAPSSTQSGCGYGASPKVQVGTSCWVKNTFTGQTYTGTCKVKGDYGGFTSATSGTCGCSVEVPTCGNGQLDFGEQCDPAKFSPWGDVNSCTDVNAPSGQKYTGGTLSCNQDCTFNTAQCTSPSTQYCGNGVREGNEGCDGTDVSGCIGSLTSGNKWACETNCWCKQVVKTYCGDGITQLPNDDAQYEVCDNGKGSPDTCGPGTHCSSCLCVQNTSQVCGDGQITGTEVCDPAKALPWGDVLGCTSLTAPNGQKYSEGTLTCSADCKSFNTAQCTSQFCGNNIREGSEQCDGSSPSVQCSIGANKVYAGCSNTCVCISRDKTYCGDGTIQTPNDSNLNEQCEGNNLNGKTCTSQGFTGGTLKCTNCQLDTSACTSTTQSCGNGKKEGTESCDGQDLSGCTGSLSPGKTWTCNTSCVCQQRNKYVCGDQIIGNPTTGSPINENGQAEVCDPGTTSKQVPECPNGYYCSNTSCLCIPLAGTYCGDGTVQSPNTQGQNEKCDPSAPKSSWACGDKEAIDCETGTCQCIYCGDGKDSPSKQCDINPGATVTPGQPVSLAFNSCSGGQICGWQAKAQGQNVAGNDLCGCVAPTISQACGDGQITGTEVCDPGSGTQGTPNYKPPKGCPTNTYCSNTCSTCVPVEVLTNSCGDGKVQQPNTSGVWEQCDEDATTKVVDWGGSQEQQGYARTCKSCQVVYDPICGNGAIDTGEKCDIKIGTTTGARFVGTCSAEEVCGWDVQGKTGAEKCQCYPKPQICGDGILSQQLGEQCELKNGAWDVSTCPTASGQNKYVCGYDVNSQKNCQCINIPSSCNGKYSALEDEGKCDGATQEEANNYCQNNSVCDLNTCNCIPIEESDSCTQSEKTVVTASGQAVKTKITTLRKTGSEFSYSDGNPPPAGAPDIKTHIGEIPSTFSEMCYQCKTSDRPATGGIRAGTLAEVISYYCPIEIKESFCGNGNPAKPFENLEAGEQCDPGEKDTNQEISINKKLGNLGNDYCKGCLRYLCYPTQINGNSGVLYQNYGGEQLFLPNEETPSLRNQQTGELEKVKLSDLTTKLPFTNLNDFELTQTTSSTKKPLSSTCWKCAPPEGEFALQLLSGSSIQKSPTTIAQQLEHLVPQPTECGEVPPPPQICIVNNIKESGEKCDFGKPETRQLPSGSETCTENCEYSKCQEINGGVSYQNFNENTPSIWQNGKIPEGLIDIMKGKVDALANYLRGDDKKKLSPTSMPKLENSCWKCDYPEVNTASLTVSTSSTTSAKVPILKRGSECAVEKKLRCCVILKTTTPAGRPITGASHSASSTAVINPSQVEYKISKQGIIITPRLTTESCSPSEVEAVDGNGNSDLTTCTPSCSGCSQIPLGAGVIHPNLVPHKTLLKSDPEDIEGPPITTPPPEKSCPKKPNPQASQEICPTAQIEGLGLVTAGDKMSLECVRTGKGNRWDYESCKCVTDPSPEEPPTATCVLYESKEIEVKETQVEPSQKPSTNIIAQSIQEINSAPTTQSSSKIGSDGKPLTGITGLAVSIEQLQESKEPVQRINNVDGTLTLVYSDKSQKVITFYPVKDETGAISSESFISRTISPDGKSTKREKLIGNKIKETYFDGTSIIYETLPDDTTRTLSYSDPSNNYIENYEYLEDNTRRVTNNLGGGYKLQKEYTDQEGKTTFRNLEELDKFGRTFKYQYITKEINGKSREITIILDKNNEVIDSSYKEGFKPFSLVCNQENKDYKCTPPEPEQYEAKQNEDSSITYTKKEGEPYWYKCKQMYVKDPSNVFGGQKKTCVMLESQGKFDEKTNTFDTQLYEYDSKTGTTKTTSKNNPNDITITNQVLNEDGTVESLTLMATTDSGQRYYPKKQSDGTILHEFEDGTKQLLSNKGEITAFWSDTGEKTEVLGKNSAGQTEYKVLSKDGSTTYYKEDGKNADGTTHYFTTKTINKNGEEIIREKTSQGFKEITYVEKEGKKVKRETQYTYDEKGNAAPQNYKDEDGQTGDFVGGQQKEITQKCGDKKEDDCVYEWFENDYQLKKIEKSDGSYESYTYTTYQGVPLTRVQRIDGTYFVLLEAENKKQETIEFFDGENHICTAKLKDNTYVQSILSNKKTSLSQYVYLNQETNKKLASLGMNQDSNQFTLRFKNEKGETFKQTPLENGYLKLEPDDSFNFFNKEIYAHPAYYSYLKENCYAEPKQEEKIIQENLQAYQEYLKPEKPQQETSGDVQCVSNAINKAGQGKAKLPEPKLVYQITDPKNNNRVVREAMLEEVDGEQAIYDYVYKEENQYLRINVKEKSWVKYEQNKPTSQLMKLQTSNQLTGEQTVHTSEKFDYQLATFSNEDSQVFKCKEYKTEDYKQPLASEIETPSSTECETNPELCTPSKCPDENSQVCGRDGKTYKNNCELKLAGAKISYEGACETICQTNEDCNSQSVCADGTQYYPKICIEKSREIENEDSTTEEVKYKTCAVNPQAATICLRAKCPPVSASNTCPQDTLSKETFNNNGCFTGYQCINANGGITPPIQRTCPTLEAPTPPVGYKATPILDTNNCVVSYNIRPPEYQPKEEKPNLEKPAGEINCDQVSVCNDGRVIKPYIKSGSQCILNPAEKCEESLLTYNSEVVDYIDEDKDGRVDIDSDNVEDSALIKKVSETRAEVVRIPFGSKDNDHDNDAIPDWLDIDKYNTGVMFTKPAYSTQEAPEDRDQDNNNDVMEMLLAGPLYAQGKGYNFENDQLNNLVSDKERTSFSSIKHALTSYAELIPGYLILKLPYTLMSNLRWSAPSVTGLVFFPAGPDSAFPSPIVEELKSEKKDKPLGYVDYLNKAYFNANKIIANNDQLRDYVDNHLNPILAKLASVNDKLKACQNFDVNKLKAEIEENAKKISTDAQTIIDDSNLETESVRDFLNSKVEVAWMALNGYDYWQNYVDNLKNAGQNYKNAKQNLQNTEKVKSSAEDAARQATQKLRDQLEDYLSKMPPERAEKAREAVTQFLDEFSGLVEDFAADPQNPERGGQYRSDLRKVQGASQKAQNQLDIFRRTSYESLLKEYGTPEAVDQARQQLLGNLDNARDIEKQLKNAAGTISRINLDGLQSKLGTLPPESKDVIGSVLNDYGKVMDSYWSAYGQESQLRNLYQTWFGEIESPPINYPTDINSLKNQQGEQFNNFAAQDILRGVLKGEISLDSGIIQTDQNGQALDITQKVMDKIKSGEKLSEEETSLLQKEVRNKVESQEKKLLDSYEDYRAQNKKEIMKQREKDLEKMKQERKEKLEQEILDAQIKAEKVKTWDWEAETEGLYGLIDVLEIKLDGVKDKRNEYLKLAQKIIMQIQKMGGDFGKAKLLYGLLSIEATKIRNEGQQMTKFIKDKKGDLAPSNLSPEERAQKYTLETYQKIKEQLQKYEDELKLASKKGEKDNLEAMIKLQKELLKKVYFQLAHNYLVARTYYHKAYIDLTTMQSITASMFLLKSFSCQLDAQLQGTHLTQPQEGAALPLVGYAINSCLTGPLASSLTGMQTADIEQQKNIPEQQASPCKVCTGIDGTPAYSEESLFSQDYKAVASATGMQVKIPSTRVEPLTPSSRTDHSITQEPRTAQNIGSTSGAPPSIPTTTVKAEIPAEKEAPISVEKIAAAKVLCPGKENERLASVNGELRAVEACQPAEIQGLTIPQEQLGQAAQNMNSCWNEYNEKYSSDAFDKFRNEQLAGLNEALLQAGLPIKATDWSDLNKPVFATAIGDQLIKIEEGKLVTQTGDTGVKIDQALNALQSFTDEKFTKPSSAKQDQCDQKSVEYTDVIQKAAKEAGYSSVQVSGSKEKPSVFAKTTDGKDVYFTEKGIPVIAGGKVSSDYAVLKDGTKAPIGLEQNGIVYDVQDGVLVKCAVVPNKDYEQYSAADKACLSKAYLENIKRQLIAAGKLEEASNIAAQQGLLTSQELASRAGELQKEAKKLEDKVKEALGDTKEKLTNILLRDDLQKLLDQAKSLREQASQLTEQALNAITDSLQETLDLKKIDFKVNLGNIKEALSLVGIKEYDEEFKKDSRYAAFKGILNPLLVSKSQNDLSIIGQKLESDSIQLQKDIENLQNPFYYRDRAREAKQLLETLTKRMLGEGTLEQQLLGMGYNSEDIEKVMTGFKQIISGYASLSSLSYNYKFGRLADYHRDLTEAMIEYDGERKHLESLQTEFASFMNVKLSKDSKETVAEELAHRINDINDRSKTRGDQSQSLTDLKKLFDPLHSSEERYAEGVLTYKSETYDLSQEQRNTLTQQINPTVEKIKRIREKIDRKEKLGSEDYISPEESNLVLLAAGMLGKGKDTHYVGLDGQNIKDADYGDFLKDIIQRKDLATALSYVISQTAMMEGEAQSRGDVDGANSWSSKRKQAEELAEYNGAVLNVLNAEDELSIYSKEQQEARITSLGRATHNANLAMLTMGQSDEDKTQTRVNYFNRLTTEWINAESAEAEQRKARGGLAWGFATSITDMLTGNMPGSTVKEHSRAATKEHNNRLIAQGGLSAVNDELATNDPDAYREQIVPTLLANAQSLVNFAGRAKSFGFDDASDLEQSSTAYSNSILQIMTRGTQISAESTTRRAISEDPSILTRRFGQEILDPKNKDQKELYIKLLVAESVNKAVKDYTSFVSNTFSGLDENSATGGMAHDLMKGLSIESGELAHKQLSDLGKTDPSKLSGQALQIYNNAKASAINTLANTLDFKGKNYNAFLSDYSAQESNFGTLLMKVGNYFYFGDSNYATKDVEKERDTAYKQADLLRSLAKGDSLTEKQHIELVKLGFDSKSTDWGLTNKDYGEFRQSTINDLSKIPIGMTGIKDVEQSWAAKMLSPREVGTQVASFFVGGLFAKAAVEGFQALRMGSEAVQAARFADTANRAAQIAGEAAQAARTAQQASRLSKVMWGLADFGVEASAFELGMGIGSAAVGDTSQLKRLVEHPVEGFVNSAGMLGTFKVAGMAFGKPAQELSSSFSKAAEEGTFGTRIAEQAKSMEGKLFNPSKPFFNAANNIATGVQLIGEIGTMMASSRAEEWYSGQESKGLLYNLAQATYQTAMMRGVAGLQHRGEGDLNSRMEADAKKTTRDYLESQARMRELLEAGEVIGKAERQLVSEQKIQAEAYTQKAQDAISSAERLEELAGKATTPEAREQFEQEAQKARSEAQSYDQSSARKAFEQASQPRPEGKATREQMDLAMQRLTKDPSRAREILQELGLDPSDALVNELTTHASKSHSNEKKYRLIESEMERNQAFKAHQEAINEAMSEASPEALEKMVQAEARYQEAQAKVYDAASKADPSFKSTLNEAAKQARKNGEQLTQDAEAIKDYRKQIGEGRKPIAPESLKKGKTALEKQLDKLEEQITQDGKVPIELLSVKRQIDAARNEANTKRKMAEAKYETERVAEKYEQIDMTRTPEEMRSRLDEARRKLYEARQEQKLICAA